jgi:hypothetical protein
MLQLAYGSYFGDAAANTGKNFNIPNICAVKNVQKHDLNINLALIHFSIYGIK